MSHTPLVSIIIPSYNRTHLIGETLDSVLAQAYTNWECIIVDDGSEQDFFEQVQDKISNDGRFILLKRPETLPKGANACRNFGMTLVKGDYVLFLDSDDLLMPHCLELRVDFFKSNPNEDFLIFQTQLFNQVPGDSKKIFNVLNKPLNDLNRFIGFDYPWHTCGAIFRTSALLQIKVCWDNALACHQDLDFYIHLLSKQPSYQKIEGKPDVYIRMEGEDKVSNQHYTEAHLQSKVTFLTNIERYITTSRLHNKKDILERLYALCVFYVQWFDTAKHTVFLKQIAHITKTPYLTFKLDATYFALGQKPSKRFRDYVFLKLYGLSGVEKSLKDLPFNTTLAYYTLNEISYAHIKVVHVSTTVSGGAGIAAFRLHEGLMNLGVPSQMLALHATTNHHVHLTKFKKPAPTRFEKIWHRMFEIKSIKRQQETLKSAPVAYEIFSLAQTPYAIHEHPLIKEADLIHLHWVAGFIDIPSFFKNIKKPIVWTLHDMNPFQGGFHYKEDEYRNRTSLGALDALQYQLKEQAYSQSNIRRIVAPSPWLLNTSKASDLLGKFSHQHIYNGVNETVFAIRDKTKARQQFDLPLDKTILLFVSEMVGNTRKGFDILLDALQDLTHEKELVLVAIGNPPREQHPDIRYLGSITNAKDLSYLYSAADLYVLPSREDNLPNVMLEALLCGTPVISTPVGGMLAVIQDGFNGYLSKNVSADAFREAILLGVEHLASFNATNIREDAVGRFALHNQANAYLGLYETVLSEHSLKY